MLPSGFRFVSACLREQMTRAVRRRGHRILFLEEFDEVQTVYTNMKPEENEE